MKKSYMIIALIVIIVVGVVVFLNNKSEKNIDNSQNSTNILKNNTNISIEEAIDEKEVNIIPTPTENEIQ